MGITRRRFIQETAATAGGVATLPLLEKEASANRIQPLPYRILGRTKVRVPLLGFGTAPLGSDNTHPDEVERILAYAISRGVTYVDTAPVYGDINSKYGNAEMKLKAALKTFRKEVFLVTKVNTSQESKDGVLRQLEASMERMGVDRVDAVHIHNLGDFNMDKLLTADGPLAGLKAAREKGWIRFIGTSGHSRPARFATVIETGDIDLTMNTLNFADRVHYDFENLVLPTAKKHGTGVVAMKVLGGAHKWQYDGNTTGVFADQHEQAIRYSLGIPGVACAVIGFASEKEVQQALDIVRALKPLSRAEKTALLAKGQEIAQNRADYYGPVTG